MVHIPRATEGAAAAAAAGAAAEGEAGGRSFPLMLLPKDQQTSETLDVCKNQLKKVVQSFFCVQRPHAFFSEKFGLQKP